MPYNIIEPADSPQPWSTANEKMPQTVNWDGTQISFNTFLTQTHTNAFLVVRNGIIKYEWYKKSITPETKLPSYSVAKTLTSIMIGQLISQGLIKESDTFIKYFPEYTTGGRFDKVTIKNLLDMSAGIAVSDNYPNGPAGWGVAIAQMYATTDLGYFLDHNRRMDSVPGTKPEYRSVDSQLLGFIIQRVTGISVSKYFSEHVWKPIQAEKSAFWNVDHKGGLEKTFCCFNATARDYARVGTLIADNGIAKMSGETVIDKKWMTHLFQPAVTLDHNWGYGAQIWHPFGDKMMMLGLHGQFIYIDPATNSVIVKLSDEPTESGNHEVITANVLRDIAATTN